MVGTRRSGVLRSYGKTKLLLKAVQITPQFCTVASTREKKTKELSPKYTTWVVTKCKSLYCCWVWVYKQPAACTELQFRTALAPYLRLLY